MSARLPATIRHLAMAGAAAVATVAPATALGQTLDTGPSPLLTALGLSALALVPFALVVTTSFAKIAVVLSILRSALGTQNVPPNLVLAALAVILSGFVMAPVAAEMSEAAAPWTERPAEDLRDLDLLGDAAAEVAEPLRRFLAANAGDAEIALFASLRGVPAPDDRLAVPLSVAVPAFTITELAEAFQIGFLLFLPFLLLDLLVGSVLLSLGMHMLTPTTVSMPFKLLLFVLVNGWMLLTESLVVAYAYPGAG